MADEQTTIPLIHTKLKRPRVTKDHLNRERLLNRLEKNDGKTPYTITVKDVPVDAFWSVTLYDDKGWIPVNNYSAYSFNNVTAKKNKDGSVTIHFGGDPKQPNFLPILPGWNYIVRLYQPKEEILNRTWTFPNPQAVE